MRRRIRRTPLAPSDGSFAGLVGSEIDDVSIDLARAALAIARTEYPSLDADHYMARLDELGASVRRYIPDPGDVGQTIRALNRVLFKEQKFRGNREDYYDPRNSFLNDVLDRKLGIPITLSLLYMEVGIRAGHFLVRHYDVGGREILLDPYDGGRALAPSDCQRRLDEIYAGQLILQPEFLVPVNRRQMLTRILNNLRGLYLGARNFRKALPIVDLILSIYPRSGEDVKQRAMLRQSTGDVRGAVTDLEDYLKMSPEASDAEEIRATALSLRRGLALMN
jgi:regulator of sirC expression with transglutaminase-like and TPR domain